MKICIESRHTSERRKQDRLHGQLARYSNDELVAELRKRGAYIMYGKDFEPITTI